MKILYIIFIYCHGLEFINAFTATINEAIEIRSAVNVPILLTLLVRNWSLVKSIVSFFTSISSLGEYSLNV